MAKLINNTQVMVGDGKKVYIDGVEVPFADFTTSLYTYDVDDAFMLEKTGKSNVNGIISTLNGKLTFQVESMVKDNAGNVYIFGPLRKMFPSLFIHKDLLPWQIAYLDNYGMPAHYKLQLWRDDSIFTIDQALHFKRGYEHAKEVV